MDRDTDDRKYCIEKIRGNGGQACFVILTSQTPKIAKTACGAINCAGMQLGVAFLAMGATLTFQLKGGWVR